MVQAEVFNHRILRITNAPTKVEKMISVNFELTKDIHCKENVLKLKRKNKVCRNITTYVCRIVFVIIIIKLDESSITNECVLNS